MKPGVCVMVVIPLGRLCAVSGVVRFAAALGLNGPLTSTMTRHMFAHIPMLLFSGMLVAYGLALRVGERGGRAGRVLAHYRRSDEFGVPGLLLARFAGACWMVPRPPDLVRVFGIASAVTFVSLFLIGMVVFDSLFSAIHVRNMAL